MRRWWVLAIAVLIACPWPVAADLATEVEEGIGNWMARAFIAQRGRLNQPPVQEWVNRVGDDLLAHASIRDLDYRFVILDSPEANGFALPGGWVFVTAGLLESMESEDELAAVIAHELGHLAHRDFQRVLLRTALWLGIAEALRNNDRDDWVPLVQGAQIVETLSHSREREARADAFGAQLAWDCGYDPRAMAAFLGDEPKWSYLQTVFATHPHPSDRTESLQKRFAQLRVEDPEGTLNLARSLIDRGRCVRAEEVLAEPLPASWEAERAALLQRITQRARPPARTDGTPLADERIATLTEATSAAGEAWVEAEKPRDLAWKRLRRLWNDNEVERGLIVAQAIDPEINDPGYLLLLAHTVNTLHRAMRGANLVARTLGMQHETEAGLETLGNTLGAVRVEPERLADLVAQAEALTARAEALSSDAVPQTRTLVRLTGDYHETARFVAPLLVELALAGEGDPAGRLTFARFMLVEARVRMLEDRLGRLDDTLDTIAADAWHGAVDIYRLRLNTAVLRADDNTRRAIFATLARRLSAEPRVFAEAWEDGVMAGDQALDLLTESTDSDGRCFGEDLRATQILMRIGFVEVKEQVAWCEKWKFAEEGAGQFALRGAVGHPQ